MNKKKIKGVITLLTAIIIAGLVMSLTACPDSPKKTGNKIYSFTIIGTDNNFYTIEIDTSTDITPRSLLNIGNYLFNMFKAATGELVTSGVVEVTENASLDLELSFTDEDDNTLTVTLDTADESVSIESGTAIGGITVNNIAVEKPGNASSDFLNKVQGTWILKFPEENTVIEYLYDWRIIINRRNYTSIQTFDDGYIHRETGTFSFSDFDTFQTINVDRNSWNPNPPVESIGNKKIFFKTDTNTPNRLIFTGKDADDFGFTGKTWYKSTDIYAFKEDFVGTWKTDTISVWDWDLLEYTHYESINVTITLNSDMSATFNLPAFTAGHSFTARNITNGSWNIFENERKWIAFFDNSDNQVGWGELNNADTLLFEFWYSNDYDLDGWYTKQP